MFKSRLSLSEIVIMHCTSNYPTPTTSANINSVRFLMERFKTRIGYSDHYGFSGCTTCVGSFTFEKHVTLSRLMDGVDHNASATIDEFNEYIRDLKNAKKFLASLEKNALKSKPKRRM